MAIQEYGDINTQSSTMKQQQTVINFPDHACLQTVTASAFGIQTLLWNHIYIYNIYYIVALDRYNTSIMITYIFEQRLRQRFYSLGSRLFTRDDYLLTSYRLLRHLRYNLYMYMIYNIPMCVYIYYIYIYYVNV